MKEGLAVRIKHAEADLRKDLQKRAQELYEVLSGKSAGLVAPGAPPQSKDAGPTLRVFYDAISMKRTCRLGSWAPAAHILLETEGCAQQRTLRDICYEFVRRARVHGDADGDVYRVPAVYHEEEMNVAAQIQGRIFSGVSDMNLVAASSLPQLHKDACRELAEEFGPFRATRSLFALGRLVKEALRPEGTLDLDRKGSFPRSILKRHGGLPCMKAWQEDKAEFVRSCGLNPADAAVLEACKEFVNASYNMGGSVVEGEFLKAVGLQSVPEPLKNLRKEARLASSHEKVLQKDRYEALLAAGLRDRKAEARLMYEANCMDEWEVMARTAELLKDHAAVIAWEHDGLALLPVDGDAPSDEWKVWRGGDWRGEREPMGVRPGSHFTWVKLVKPVKSVKSGRAAPGGHGGSRRAPISPR
jgi:hypothetical protein